MKRILAMSAAACLAAAGCADLHTPNVTLKGADQAKYEADLAQCRNEAKLAVSEEGAVVGGTILGAFLGAVLGFSATGPFDGGTGTAIGAAAGGAAGALAGGVMVASKQADTIDGCLLSRGYTVRL